MHKKLPVPQGYQQTEIGVIPQDWEVVRLGDLLSYEQPIKYLVSNTNYDNAHKIPVLTAGKTFILGYTNENSGIYDNKLPVIIFDDFTTATKFVNFPFKAKSSAMKILKSKNDSVNIKLVYELMQRISYATNDHKRYWISEYQEIEIKIPPKPEQQKIADILTTWDNAIEKQTALIEKKQQLKKGLMQQLLTGKTRFSEFGDDWESVRLGDISEYKNGGSFESEIIDNGQYYLITLNSIDINGNMKEKHKTINSNNNSLRKNDLIMMLSDVAHGYFLGLTNIIPQNNKYILNQRVGSLRLNKNINSIFLSKLINLNQRYFKRHGQGSSQQNLSKGSVIRFKLNLPSLQEQTKIAQVLSLADNEITQSQTKLALLKTQKKGLMQQLLTGKIRVKI